MTETAEAATEDPLDPPFDSSWFEPYEIVRRLGEGSFARVFLARNQGVRQSFAIKVLKPELAADARERQTFLDEADLLHQISHTRVIAARHVDAKRDVPWFVMDFAERGTLEDWVRRLKQVDGFTLSVEQLVGLGVELCECLSALHDYSVVHYDLKPHNVLIRSLGDAVDQRRGSRYRLPPDQRLTLGDLGFARITGSLDERVGGTPQYVAPEVAGHGEGSERSDLFALGVMLYEFAHPRAGGDAVLPYAGRIPSSDPRRRHLLADPSTWGPYRSLSSVRPDLPTGFDDVVRRALAPDPTDRFSDATELGWALESLLRRPAAPTPDRLVSGVEAILSTASDQLENRRVDPEVHETLDRASARLRRPTRVAVLSDGDADTASFTLFLAGEPVAATAPYPFGSVISYLRDSLVERILVESQSGDRTWRPILRGADKRLRSDVEISSPRQLTLELDRPELRSLVFVDIPAAVASDTRTVNQAVGQADIAVVLLADSEQVPRTMEKLRQAARRSLAGPCILVAVDTSTPDFGEASSAPRDHLEDTGFQQVLPLTNAGLTLRVYLQNLIQCGMGHVIAASAALALCETACDRSNQWDVAKEFIDGRDELEAEFPELRDLRCLREDVRRDFELPTPFAAALREMLSQPTAAGKLDLRADQADIETVRRVAEERLVRWMSALADGSIPADSADAARVVVAGLRRLQDASEL